MNIWPLTLCVLLIIPLNVFPQSTVQEQLRLALRLEGQGQYARAISILEPIATSGKVSRSEIDRIWTYIGYARQEQGNFEGAQGAYEKAIQVARTLPKGTGDYAAALDNQADLDQARGDLRSASRLERRVLQLFQESGNHACAAWTFTHLAVIELTRRHEQSASRYLQRAAKEAQSAPQLGKDYYASLASANAWLAELEGDPLTAIVEYQRSIASPACSNCAPMGWQEVLLGKAYADSGQLSEAQKTMRLGLTILAGTAGEHTLKYLAAEIAYAQVLDETGQHSQSAALKMSAQRELTTLDHVPCRTCVDLVGIP
jgi:tetratricopeptide (TPR) repeat protein